MPSQSETTKTTGKVEKNAMQASEFSGLASDSREVKPGYLFAALTGSKMNGAVFIEEAVKRGATAVLGRPDVEPAVRSSSMCASSRTRTRAAASRAKPPASSARNRTLSPP